MTAEFKVQERWKTKKLQIQQGNDLGDSEQESCAYLSHSNKISLQWVQMKNICNFQTVIWVNHKNVIKLKKMVSD